MTKELRGDDMKSVKQMLFNHIRSLNRDHQRKLSKQVCNGFFPQILKEFVRELFDFRKRMLSNLFFRLGSGYVNYGNGERSSSKKTTIKRERVEDKETKQILDDLLRDDVIRLSYLGS